MFKWTKDRPSDHPSTPKLSSISLPDDPHSKKPSTPQWPPDPEKKSKILSSYPDAGRRSKTPHPISSKHHQEMAEGHTRTRTTSLSSRLADGLSKPSKLPYNDEFIKPAVPVPSLDKGGSHYRGQTDSYAAPPHKSILKGGGYSHQTSSAKHLEKIPPHAGHFSKYGVPPPAHPSSQIGYHTRHTIPPPVYPSTYPGYSGRYDMPLSNHPQEYYHRSRNQSFAGHEAHPAPTSTSRYVKPHITKVPQKEEAIALSWPLTDSLSRGRVRQPKPVVYFDVGFDPRNDLRARRDGNYYTRLSEEERNTPASSHCDLTEMVIIGPGFLERWPIVIRRAQGIRCFDVFQEIYNTYEKQLTNEDKEVIGHEYLARCQDAFKLRCKESPGLTLYNEKCGMLRVDLLKGARIFKGLTRDTETATWRLQIHKPQRP